MRILLLNRRDRENPLGGGAEIYTHEIFRRLADRHDITHFSSSFPGAPSEQTLDGIRYLRRGSELTMHGHAFRFARRHRKAFDLIVDQFNGIGMLTCWFGNSLLLIHQLYDTFWTAKLGWPGHLFRLVEQVMLRRYRRRPAVTVSASTRDDLLRHGFAPETVFLVPNGADPPPPLPDLKRSDDLMYLGRMEKTKNPADALRCLDLVRASRPHTRLHMVGDGEERERLARSRADDEGIVFWGFVEEAEKFRLLGQAAVLIVPSLREGWGQVVIQANAMGTPVVGYRVPGIQDSVRDGLTGYLVPPGDVEALAGRACALLNDDQARRNLSAAARKHAAQFSWDHSAEAMEQVLEQVTREGSRGNG
jgi:glycosyltransferase involved in cell wall biosynthesis